MASDEQMYCIAAKASVEAGQAILEVYGTDFEVETKEDHSPLTQADKASHRVIMDRISGFSIPVLSEEGREMDYAERSPWQELWIVDPLDGTKEFVKRNGEFTVNIALVRRGRPVFGAVYVPVTDVLYLGALDQGCVRLDQAGQAVDRAGSWAELLGMGQSLPRPREEARPYTIMGSRSHPSAAVEAFVKAKEKEHGEVAFISAGSSLKICLVAEGAADVYPRLGPTMEWDTAAGQAVAESAGARVYVAETGQPLGYNREDLLNPHFIVER